MADCGRRSPPLLQKLVLIRLAQLRSLRAAPRLPEDDRRVPGPLSGRGSLPRVPLRLSLAGWLPLSGVRFGSRLAGDDAAAVAVSGLPPPGLGDRWHGPAQDQDSTTPLVLGGLLDDHGDARRVGAPAL